METAPYYELSASYMNGLVKAARDAGFLDGVMATLPQDLQAAYLRPALKPWWDARLFEQLVVAIGAQFGDQGVDTVGYGVAADSIGAQAAPAVQALMAAPGAGPGTLLAQMEQFINLAVRPVHSHWELSEAGRGRLDIHYPHAVRREVAILWRGALRYVFEISGRPGKVDLEIQGPVPGQLGFEVSWSP